MICQLYIILFGVLKFEHLTFPFIPKYSPGGNSENFYYRNLGDNVSYKNNLTICSKRHVTFYFSISKTEKIVSLLSLRFYIFKMR